MQAYKERPAKQVTQTKLIYILIFLFHCELLYMILGSATIEDLSSCCFEDLGVILACCCIRVSVGSISSPTSSSFFGASSAVILRSRAVSSDLSCFNSSSLPHVLATMASSWGTSALRLALQDCRASLICCQALLYAVDNILVVHEELFEDVVDYIADVTGRALFR